MTSKHPGQHSGDLFRRGRVDPCGGWFGWWYWRFLDESLGIFTECLIKRDLAGHMNGVDLAIMHLVGGHQTDPGMVMVLVVPVEELAAEASGVLDTAEASWEARLILQGLEVAFRERVVVGRVRAVMRPGDASTTRCCRAVSARAGRGRRRVIAGGAAKRTRSRARPRSTVAREIPTAAQTAAVIPLTGGRATTTLVKARRRPAPSGFPAGPQVFFGRRRWLPRGRGTA